MIFDPVNRLMQSFLSEPDSSRISLRTRDLIARRRLHWVGELLAKRVQEFVADPTVDTRSEFVSSIKQSIQKWQMPALFDRLNSVLKHALIGELTEELLYQARSHLPNPLDETMWCNIAIDLTLKVARSIAKYLLCSRGQAEIRKQHLGEDLLKHAMEASKSVRNGAIAIEASKTVWKGTIAMNNLALQADMDACMFLLSFKPAQRTINEEILLDKSSERMISLYDVEDTKKIHFGTAAAMANIQAYYDAVDLCGIESYYIPGKTRKVSEGNHSIVSKYETDRIHDSGIRNQQFYWIPRNMDEFKKGNARVNEKWYLENQVFVVVHVLASTCVDWSHFAGEDAYSLETLCRKINLDLTDAKRALSRGAVNPTWPEPVFMTTSYSPALSDVNSKTISIRRRHKAQHRDPTSSKQDVYKGPDAEFPGWTVQHIQRAKSVRVDYFWSHPELEGVLVRSKVGLRLLVNYANKECVSLRAAYEMNRGMKTFFIRS